MVSFKGLCFHQSPSNRVTAFIPLLFIAMQDAGVKQTCLLFTCHMSSQYSHQIGREILDREGLEVIGSNLKMASG